MKKWIIISVIFAVILGLGIIFKLTLPIIDPIEIMDRELYGQWRIE